MTETATKPEEKARDELNYAPAALPPTEPYPYTEQQIEDFCDVADDLTFSGTRPPTNWQNGQVVFDAVQIIRQLQGEVERLKEFEWKYNDLCK